MARFPLAMQTVLPERYRQDDPFRLRLEALARCGFTGVELNVTDPARVDFAELQDFLRSFGLACTCLASGLTARTQGLSLCARDTGVRERSVDACLRMIDRIAGTGIALIIGFLKGPPGGGDREQDRLRFLESLARISPCARDARVRVLIEATNRYEASVANTLEAAAALIRGFENPMLRVLPDTFHMNIEEADPPGALRRFAPWCDSVHLSDNNRRLPGRGCLRFGDILAVLRESGFRGTLALEGDLGGPFEEEVEAAAAYLAPLLL